MRHHLLAAAVLCLALQPVTVYAAADGNPLPLTAGELVRSIKICRDAGVTSVRVADFRACSGYLAGIIVGATAALKANGSQQIFCLPADAGDTTIQNAVIEFVDSHQEIANGSVPAGVLKAMASSFPCK